MEYIILTIAITREGDYHVSRCQELGTASFGASEEEAIANVIDATQLYLDTLGELGECDTALASKDVAIHRGTSAGRRLTCLPDAVMRPIVFELSRIAA